MSKKKVGGIWFFRVLNWRITVCRIKPAAAQKPLPTWHLQPFYLEK